MIRELGTDKSSLTRMVDEARHTIDQLKQELHQSRSSMAMLTVQLSHSYAAREEGATKAARYNCTTSLATMLFVHSAFSMKLRE